MNDQKDIVCHIKGDGTVSVLVEEAGIKTAKVLSLETFCNTLKYDNERIELPLFPNGMRKYVMDGDSLVIAVEYPERVIENFKYLDETYSIPAPKSVWIFFMGRINGSDQYRVHKVWPFALDMPLLGESQMLYKWPFPNWSLSHGSICWGNDPSARELMRSCKVANVSSFYSIFFNARANADLGWDLDYRDDDNRGVRPEKFLDGKDSFDPAWLIRQGVTFSEAINKITGRSR